ncbi:hypothetical protein PO909_025621 [Leuciscus waleckii]
MQGLRFIASERGRVWEWPGNEQPLSSAQGVRRALYIVISISKRDGQRARDDETHRGSVTSLDKWGNNVFE